MNVRDLIAALNEHDPEAEVHFAYPSGDYWRNVLAPAVDTVEEGYVKYSEYHSRDKLMDIDEDEGIDADPKVRDVVIIR